MLFSQPSLIGSGEKTRNDRIPEPVAVHQETLEVRTRSAGLSNITAEVSAVAQRSRVTTGLCTVFVQHTSASLVIQENADPADAPRSLALHGRSRARVAFWEHDDEGPDDMPAHAALRA